MFYFGTLKKLNLNLKPRDFFRFALVSVCVYYFSSLNAQSLDSIGKVKVKTEYQSLENKIPSKDSISKQAKLKLTETKKTLLDKGASKFSLSKIKGETKVFTKKAVEKVSHPHISIKGTIENQSYATNAQNPYLKNNEAYSRFYFRPVISIYSIPIRIDGFYTTETQGQYRNSYFQVSLDMETMEANAKAKIAETLKAKQREYSYKSMDLQSELNLEAKAKAELTKAKSKCLNLQSLRKQAEMQLENEKQKAMNRAKHISDSLQKKAINKKDRYKNKALSKADSIKEAKKDKLKSGQDSLSDSLKNNKLYGSSMKRIDSLQRVYDTYKQKEETLRKQADSIENKYKQIVEKYNQIKTLLKSDSLSIDKYKDMLKNPSSAKLLKKLPGNLGNVEITKLAIGQVAPAYSELGMNGIPVKGGEIMLKTPKWFLGTSLGKTTNPIDFYSLDNKLPVYDKHVGAIIVGRQFQKNNYYVHVLHINDDSKANPKRNYNEQNTVFVTGGIISFKKVIRLSGEMAASLYSRKSINTLIEYKGEAPVVVPDFSKSLKEASAIKANIEYDFSTSTMLSAKFERMGQGFKNMGNPFMRHDYMIKEIKLNQSLFDNKIRLEAFYKEGSDNLNNERNYTNKNKGLGFKGRTAFRKYPNLMVMYSPFQFGNNHPDTALRTRNQIDFTMASLTWFKTFGKIKSGSMINYSNSKQNFQAIPDVSVTTYSLNQTLGVKKNLQFIIGATYSKTLPSIDSVNCFSQSAGVYHSPNSKLTWNMTLDNVSYFNHGYKRGGTIGGTLLLVNNSTMTLQGGLSQIHKIWGKDNALVYFVRLGVQWKW